MQSMGMRPVVTDVASSFYVSVCSVNQSISQSINQSINQSIDLSIDRSISGLFALQQTKKL